MWIFLFYLESMISHLLLGAEEDGYWELNLQCGTWRYFWFCLYYIFEKSLGLNLLPIVVWCMVTELVQCWWYQGSTGHFIWQGSCHLSLHSNFFSVVYLFAWTTALPFGFGYLIRRIYTQIWFSIFWMAQPSLEIKTLLIISYIFGFP